jgi:flagellar biosynthesis component FlhA
MLLLVPRLTAILIIVVGLMLLTSLITNKLGMERTLSVALFPMVILAMTIERMSITWEESGARDAILNGLGSLLIASLSYLVMNQRDLEHLVFVFPELLLVALGLSLLMGRYTGYRLSELRRFRDFRGTPHA